MRAFILFLIVCLLPIAAHADDREEAAREFARGQAADKRRDWQAAIDHYKRANELLPHPYALYNIAVDYERLGQYRNSATYYDSYLDAAPSASDREKVNRKILELRNRPAKLIVRSDPPGATVKIQGLPAGSTPLKTEREGGIYRIVVEKDGDRDARDITVEYGEPVEIDVQLRGATAPAGRAPAEPRPGPTTRPVRTARNGTLVVQGVPAGAFVSIDNEPAGNLPLRVAVIEGLHVVHVHAQGHQPFQTQVQVVPDREVVVEARMPRLLGGPPPKVREPRPQFLHYLVGGAAGIDTRADGAAPVFLGELGIRANKYDITSRVGSIGGQFAFDVALRWQWFDARFSPFVGFGYSYVNAGLGWELLGGFRTDLTKSEKYGMSLVVEGQLRWFAQQADEMASGLSIPIVGSLQVLYR